MSNAMVLRPQTFDQLVTFADLAARSKMVPAAYRDQPADIMLAIQMGSELGLAPMQSLQNIAVINGRPSVWGDAMLGLCRSSQLCQSVEEIIAGEGDAMRATCTAKRAGNPDVVSTFSVEDAKKAGLWGKAGPWQQYPKRMLQMRARGFALRDAFPDILRGLISGEEAADMPVEGRPFIGTTITGAAEPASAGPSDPRGAINEAVPLAASPTPADKARAAADRLLAKIADCLDENAVHDMLGAANIQRGRDIIKRDLPEADEEIARAITKRFNDFAIPAGPIDADDVFAGAA